MNKTEWATKLQEAFNVRNLPEIIHLIDVGVELKFISSLEVADYVRKQITIKVKPTLVLKVIVVSKNVAERKEFTLSGDISILGDDANQLAFDIERKLNELDRVRVHASIE